MDILQILKKDFPARDRQIEELFNLFSCKDERFVQSIFIHGATSTGKTHIVRSTLSRLGINFSLINLTRVYNTRHLFEDILNDLVGYKCEIVEGKYEPHARCENLMDFIDNLQKIARNNQIDNSVIILDHAEELRNMEFNLLPAFLRLEELTDIPITVIFISEIIFEKYYFKLNIIEPIKIYFPQYNKDELIKILSNNITNPCQNVDFKNALELTNYDVEFYQNYLNIFLQVFYRACRDLRELEFKAKENFVAFCKPIAEGDYTVKDILPLWKHISPILINSKENLYLRVHCDSTVKALSSLVQNLELPFYAKYLLIAAYLASYNPIKNDKRLFMKHHGKQTKTKADIKKKSKVSEQLNTQMGPKPFTLDRLLAIFYTILQDNKIGFNNHILIQVSTLTELQLLTLFSDNNTLDQRKYKCNVNFDTIQSISKMVGFNIRKYLTDFCHI